MKNKQFLPLITIIFLIVSCSNSDIDKGVDAKDIAKTDKPENQDTIEIDLSTETRYAFVKNIVESNGNLYVKVDYVDYLTGTEALDAEKRDQAYFIDGRDTISNINNGYYISNVNPKIRMFKVGINATIENIIDDDGPQKIKPPKKLSNG